jgi:hypothetical protein
MMKKFYIFYDSKQLAGTKDATGSAGSDRSRPPLSGLCAFAPEAITNRLRRVLI